MKNIKKTKFAVIGMGFIYPRHRQAIQKNGGEVYLTCDIDKEYKPDFTDWVEMFNHPKFEKVTHVSICTPNYLHSVITREAILRGKKVICEKPFSLNGIKGIENAKSILQLRYHPALKKLKKPKELVIVAKMFRDNKYWDSWKGNDVKSGGILYNLGVHYIDLAIFLLGNKWEIMTAKRSKNKIVAGIKFEKSIAHIHIEIVNDKSKQGRKMIADGKEIILSNQENLSYEDLHTKAFSEFLKGRGISAKEADKSLQLIKAIYANAV